MSYAKMIHDYIDGGLDSTNEQAMFALLSESDELRHEFNSQFKMHLAAQEEMSQIAPPIHVTNAIFAGLGMAVPVNLVQSPTSSIKRFLSKFSPAILLLLFFGALGWGLLEYQKNRDLESQLSSSSGKSSNNIPMMSSFSDDVVDGELDNSNVINSRENRFANNNIGNSNANAGNFSSSNGNSMNNSANENSMHSRKNSDEQRAEKTSQDLSLGLINRIDESSRLSNNSASLIGILSSSDARTVSRFGNSASFGSEWNSFYVMPSNAMVGSRYQVQFRRLDPQFDSPSFESSRLQNPGESYAIAFWYAVNDFHSFGIEIGQEAFNQEFKTADGLQYLQSPVLLWGGASYRLSAKEWIAPYYLYPYVQQSIGASTIGPISKSQIGIVWQVASPISINIGMEYGVLFYNVNSKLYNSQKFGITGGLNIGF